MLRQPTGRPRRVVPRGADRTPVARSSLRPSSRRQPGRRTTTEDRCTARCPRRSTCPRSTTTSSPSGASSDVFDRSLAATEGRPLWVFYEGPPTANGMPGTHHVEARVFKDVFPRYRTMKGYHVPRKAGWDCHGLPGRARGREGARLHRQEGHRGVRRRRVQRALPRVGAAPRRRVRRDDRADGLLGRHGRRLLDDGPAVRRERVVVAQADLRQGPARPGPPRRAVLPALRHRPVRPRARAGLRDRRRPVGLRPVPVTGGDLVARHPGPRCSSGPPRRGRWCPTPRGGQPRGGLRRHPHGRRRDARRRRGAARRGARRGLHGARDRPRRELVGTPYSRPFNLVEIPETDAPVHTVLRPTT